MNNSVVLVSGAAAGLRHICHRVKHTLSIRVFRSALVSPSLIIAGALLLPVPAKAYDATGLVSAEARKQGVPVHFALKMARIESGVQCGRRNPKSTASGPLQVLKGTARSLGYKGDIRRASCGTQTYYGMKHLAMCYRAAKGNQALAKRCHQQGISAIYKKRKRK
jgi:soluble lytic murein transglycosylase-like protein